MVAKDFRKFAALLSLLPLLMVACDTSTGDQSDKEATAQALSESVRATGTAAAIDQKIEGNDVATAQAEATQKISLAAATETAQAAIDDQSLEATAQAIAPIKSELPRYGVDPNQGQIGWIHPPEVIDIEGYLQHDYANKFMGTVAQDFVISADITWNTDYGTSGCGFVLRSDGDEEAPNQYMTLATRGANGHVVFATMAEGEVVTGQDIYAYGLDPNFQWQNDTTNRLTIVGIGDRFSIYTNDTLIGEVNPSDPPPQPYIPPPPVKPEDLTDTQAVEKYLQEKDEYDDVVNQIRANYSARVDAFEDAEKVFEKGFVSFVAVSESGRTTCHFDNAWLWLIN